MEAIADSPGSQKRIPLSMIYYGTRGTVYYFLPRLLAPSLLIGGLHQ